MYCTQCGYELDQADAYCSKCGNPTKVDPKTISKNFGPTQAGSSKTFYVKGKEINLRTKKKFMNIEGAKGAIFAKIETRDNALKTIKETSITFLVIFGIQAAIGYFIVPSMVIDAVLFAVFSLILLKWKARTAAVILLLLSGIVVVVTFMNKLGIISEGGTNIFLAVIILWTAIRAVEATFKLHGMFAKEST